MELLRMLPPPLFPTGLTAENAPFVLGPLLNDSTTFTTDICSHSIGNIHSLEMVPAAETFYGIFGNPKLFPNFSIAAASAAELCDLFFLLPCHFIAPPTYSSRQTEKLTPKI